VIEMCIAYPGIVVEVDSLGATVETDGRRRRVSALLVPDAAIGDWVAVAVGTIIRRLDPKEAADIQRLMRAAIEATPYRTKEGALDVQSH
jgi:hydrogenase expression/formation protein HypC